MPIRGNVRTQCAYRRAITDYRSALGIPYVRNIVSKVRVLTLENMCEGCMHKICTACTYIKHK